VRNIAWSGFFCFRVATVAFQDFSSGDRHMNLRRHHASGLTLAGLFFDPGSQIPAQEQTRSGDDPDSMNIQPLFSLTLLAWHT
jgi:hypothetical protein